MWKPTGGASLVLASFSATTGGHLPAWQQRQQQWASLSGATLGHMTVVVITAAQETLVSSLQEAPGAQVRSTVLHLQLCNAAVAAALCTNNKRLRAKQDHQNLQHCSSVSRFFITEV